MAQHVLQDCRLYSNVRQSIWRERVDMHTKLYVPLPELEKNGSLHCPGWNRNLKRASENEKKKKKKKKFKWGGGGHQISDLSGRFWISG